MILRSEYPSTTTLPFYPEIATSVNQSEDPLYTLPLQMLAAANRRQENLYTPEKADLSLSERIIIHGKVRFLFICDENIGRSRIFSAAMRRLLEVHGLSHIAESMSAGTDVDEKKSYLKFPDGHPAVVFEQAQHKITDHDYAKQLHRGLITPNTMGVMLNKREKTSKALRDLMFCRIDAYAKDPGRKKKVDPLELGHLSEYSYMFGRRLIADLRDAIARNSLSVFQSKVVDIRKFYLDY